MSTAQLPAQSAEIQGSAQKLREGKQTKTQQLWSGNIVGLSDGMECSHETQTPKGKKRDLNPEAAGML